MKQKLQLSYKKYDLFTYLAFFLSCFVLSFITSSLVIQPQPSKAVDGLGLVSTPTMSLSTSTDSLNLTVVPTTAGTLASSSHNLTAITNVPTGYTLSLVAAAASTIAPSTGTFSAPTTLANNTWGYAVPGAGGFDANYAAPTPNAASKWANPNTTTTIKNTTNPTTGDNTTIYYGTKIDLNQTSGTYSHTVQYTATANISAIPTPRIFEVTPGNGPTTGDTAIKIIGTGFTINDQSITTAVTLDNIDCRNVSISSNTSSDEYDTIFCDTPAHAPGAVDVTVATWGGTSTISNEYTYQDTESFKFTIDTRLTDTLDTDPAHYNNLATTFIIPTTGQVKASPTGDNYNWLIDWGDNSPAQIASGISSDTNAGISHNYPSPGEYQITISSNGHAVDGWMNAFGFFHEMGIVGANAEENKNMLKTIDTPIPKHARSSNHPNRFAYMFMQARNLTIPEKLFLLTDTANDTDFSNMFSYTFLECAANITATAGIPANLFANIDTTNATNLSSMFKNTFGQYGENSTAAIIPPGLFRTINTQNATDLSNMFYSTFSAAAINSIDAMPIPANLFISINAPNAVNLDNMFRGTFSSYAYRAKTGTIPSGLFAFPAPLKAANMAGMFSDTFRTCFGYSSEGTIPAGLFDAIDTSDAADLSDFFKSTFSSYSGPSLSGTIPTGIFNSINTVNATNLSGMFNSTFSGFATDSTSAVIPSGIFSTIAAHDATNLSGMFMNTFTSYAKNSSGAIPSDLFDSINPIKATNVSNMFRNTFKSYGQNSSTATIPFGLFASISAGAANMSNMFRGTFSEYAQYSTSATIPEHLFDALATHSATNLSGMFIYTFQNYAYKNTSATIPADLFAHLDLSSATNVSSIFLGTFKNFAFSNKTTDSTPDTDINSIWGNVNFAGKITASNVGNNTCTPTAANVSGAFCQTFFNMPSLIGTAQTFIDNKLGGITPSSPAITFRNTSVSDLATLNANWK